MQTIIFNRIGDLIDKILTICKEKEIVIKEIIIFELSIQLKI